MSDKIMTYVVKTRPRLNDNHEWMIYVEEGFEGKPHATYMIGPFPFADLDTIQADIHRIRKDAQDKFTQTMHDDLVRAQHRPISVSSSTRHRDNAVTGEQE